MATVDRSQFPKSSQLEGIPEFITKMGSKIAQAAFAMVGTALPKGAFVGPGAEAIASLVSKHLAESKEASAKAKQFEISPEEYKERKESRKQQEEIKEIKELQKKLNIGATSVDPKYIQGLGKDIKEGLGEVAESISDQPKKQIEELKKAGFGEKKELKKAGFGEKKEKGGVTEALFGGLKIPEARQQAIQLALGATGLGGIEEIFGVSGRVEKLIAQTKEKRAIAKEEETTAKKLGVSAEEYREAQKSAKIKEERKGLYEEALSLGLEPKGFSDIAAEIEEEEEKKKAEKAARKAGKEGAPLSEEIFADFIDGVKEGVTEGLKESGMLAEGQADTIAAIAENTEKTHEEVSDLHKTLKGESTTEGKKEKKDKEEKKKEEKDKTEEKEDEKKKEGKGLISSIISGILGNPTALLGIVAIATTAFAIYRIREAWKEHFSPERQKALKDTEDAKKQLEEVEKKFDVKRKLEEQGLKPSVREKTPEELKQYQESYPERLKQEQERVEREKKKGATAEPGKVIPESPPTAKKEVMAITPSTEVKKEVMAITPSTEVKKEVMATQPTEVKQVPIEEYKPTPGGGQERILGGRASKVKTQAERIKVSPATPMVTPPLGEKPTPEKQTGITNINLQSPPQVVPNFSRNASINELHNLPILSF